MLNTVRLRSMVQNAGTTDPVLSRKSNHTPLSASLTNSLMMFCSLCISRRLPSSSNEPFVRASFLSTTKSLGTVKVGFALKKGFEKMTGECSLGDILSLSSPPLPILQMPQWSSTSPTSATSEGQTRADFTSAPPPPPPPPADDGAGDGAVWSAWRGRGWRAALAEGDAGVGGAGGEPGTVDDDSNGGAGVDCWPFTRRISFFSKNSSSARLLVKGFFDKRFS
mmetsp:Transcript_32634/g.80782  ORF Transcript_32634/g.80782 Transcript_32634/m.80782 type:complete len:223 (+) Transcript_32634:320-988(+)